MNPAACLIPAQKSGSLKTDAASHKPLAPTAAQLQAPPPPFLKAFSWPINSSMPPDPLAPEPAGSDFRGFFLPLPSVPCCPSSSSSPPCASSSSPGSFSSPFRLLPFVFGPGFGFAFGLGAAPDLATVTGLVPCTKVYNSHWISWQTVLTQAVLTPQKMDTYHQKILRSKLSCCAVINAVSFASCRLDDSSCIASKTSSDKCL